MLGWLTPSQSSLVCSAAATASCHDLDRTRNFALSSDVDSPDLLEQDWCVNSRQGCVDKWAADGDESTYWDEEDDQSQYHLRIRRKEGQEVNISGVSISGYAQHYFAPRSFQLVCDEVVVANVEDAVYQNNVVEICFSAAPCRVLDLVIFQAYGGSPAVREIQLFAAAQAAESAPGRLLLPTSAQNSTCAHLAGRLLLCLGEGNLQTCSEERMRHWNCIKHEVDGSKQGIGGHRNTGIFSTIPSTFTLQLPSNSTASGARKRCRCLGLVLLSACDWTAMCSLCVSSSRQATTSSKRACISALSPSPSRSWSAQTSRRRRPVTGRAGGADRASDWVRAAASRLSDGALARARTET
eukprot:767178-Hanusia_phi.AAC.3